MKSGTSTKQATKMPDYAGKLGYSDMTAFDADGKPQRGFSTLFPLKTAMRDSPANYRP